MTGPYTTRVWEAPAQSAAEIGSIALAATVCTPELVQRRRQHEGVCSARAICNPGAVVVACWPRIEAELARHLDDLSLLALLCNFRRQFVAHQLLADRVHDVRQFVAREEARQIWRP